MALFLFHDNRADIGDQILVGRSFAKERTEVVVVLAEKAGAELAVRGQADARAVATERLGHRRDEADFSGRAISKAVFARSFAAFMRNLRERPAGVDALVDFRGGHHEIAR